MYESLLHTRHPDITHRSHTIHQTSPTLAKNNRRPVAEKKTSRHIFQFSRVGNCFQSFLCLCFFSFTFANPIMVSTPWDVIHNRAHQFRFIAFFSMHLFNLNLKWFLFKFTKHYFQRIGDMVMQNFHQFFSRLPHLRHLPNFSYSHLWLSYI